jgi:hypothetical protein
MWSIWLGGSSAGLVARVVGSGVSWCLVRNMTVLLLAGATERPSTGILSVGWSPAGRCGRIARQVLESMPCQDHLTPVGATGARSGLGASAVVVVAADWFRVDRARDPSRRINVRLAPARAPAIAVRRANGPSVAWNPHGAAVSDALGSVRCGTVIGRRGRVYVSQVDDDVRIGGDTVTGVTGIVHK